MDVLQPDATAVPLQFKADIFDLILSPALILDGVGVIVEANQAFQAVFGISAKGVKGSCFPDILTTDETSKERIKNSYTESLVEGRTSSFESCIMAPCGKEIWVLVNNRVFRQDGRLYCLTILTDESAQKKALKDVEASYQNIKNILENVNDMVQSIGPDGRIIYANQKWLRTMGYQESEIAGLNMTDILRKDQISHCSVILERVKNGEQFEFVDTVFRTKDGAEILAEGNITGEFEDGRFIATRGIFRDVTYKKNLEETYTSLIKNSPTAMYVVQNGRFKFVNPSLLSLTGYAETELLERESISLVHSEDRTLVARSAINSLKSRRANSYEFRLITKQGEVRWVMETVISIPFEGGRAALGTIVDLSQHKMFEKALEEANGRYQTLFNSAGDAIYIHDNSGRFLEVNDAACTLLGHSRPELLKLNIGDFYFSGDQQAFKRYLQEITTAKVYFADSEMTIGRNNGIPVEINCKLVTYQSKPAVLTVARDITERKQIESIRLKNQARIESLLKIAEYPVNDAQDLLYFGLEEMVKLAESKYGFLYTYDESKQQLGMRALSKDVYRVANLTKREYNCELANCGILGEAVRLKKAIICSTTQAPRLAANGFPDGNYKIDQYLAVPIWRSNKIVGIAGVANKCHEYDSSDIQQVSLLINSVWNILERLKAEKTLAASQQRYRQLIELSMDGILALDADGRITMANPAACKMFGYAEAEMLKMRVIETMIAEERPDAFQRWKEVTEGRFPRYERQAVRKDGGQFPIEVSISTLPDGNCQEVIRDISMRREMEFQLQESEKKYRQMVENQSDLISELTPTAELKFANPAYLKLLGKTEKEVIGTKIVDLMHPDDRELGAQESLPATFPPYFSHSEVRMLTTTGWRWIAWNVNGVPGPDGKVTAFTGVGRDITEAKQAKEELELANERLRELDKLKDNFLSTVSHELRTPLTSIKSFTEILLSYDEDPKTQKEFLGIINNESDRLTRLINDFLDISKIQAGRMQWKTQPVSIAEVIQEAVKAARPVFEKEKLQVVSEIESDLPSVLSDKDRLIQVVTNLLGNAIKFTPENGSITLKAWRETKTDNAGTKMVTISVTDSGIGIAPENHHKIFENFGQVGDVLKDRPRGTGLGLPICKKIVETFGGRIWVESEIGKGSAFFFSLPQVAATTGLAKGS